MNLKRIEVLFSPAEYALLPARDLSETACVVFDIFRATTTMLTALANGAEGIVPVSEIDEALQLRAQKPELLLAGERGGLRIRADQTGGIDFDFGNSPREFTPSKVQGRRIAITTTNGTRALRACRGAGEIHIGSFRNMSALAQAVGRSPLPRVLIVCAGTAEDASMEDTLAAGALVELLAENTLTDSARIARAVFLEAGSTLADRAALARNGRKLLGIPELRDDFPFCLERDALALTARVQADGVIRGG